MSIRTRLIRIKKLLSERPPMQSTLCELDSENLVLDDKWNEVFHRVALRENPDCSEDDLPSMSDAELDERIKSATSSLAVAREIWESSPRQLCDRIEVLTAFYELEPYETEKAGRSANAG